VLRESIKCQVIHVIFWRVLILRGRGFIMRGDEGASGIFRNLAFRSVDLVPFDRLKDGTDGQSVW